MLLIVFSSHPACGMRFEQGLEVALTAADLELEVEILFEAECAQFLMQAAAETDSVKKLGQLGLYDLSCMSTEPISIIPCRQVGAAQVREHCRSAHAILVV